DGVEGAGGSVAAAA
nr:hypothetical protein [Tanacetum cinerariifolium]